MEEEGKNHPVVRIENGQAKADSRDVASYFGKRHDNVLRDVRQLDCSPQFHALNFEGFKNKDLTGENVSHVMMTRDGFVFLVMGYTGAKAAKLKEAYIEQFNTMEQVLRERGTKADVDDWLARLPLVTEARLTFGTRKAGEMWVKLGLPTVADMAPPQGELF